MVTGVQTCALPISPRHGTRVEQREVHDAQILAVDEAHNFLNRDANRTQQVRESHADHVALFTATPINRGAGDLLHLVGLLGADNFEDATLAVLRRLERARTDQTLNPAEIEQLRSEIQRFTVRRTKSMLNRLVDREPNAYLHPDTGRVCRYPRHDSRIYPTGETVADEEAATVIRTTAHELVGVGQLERHLYVPAALRRDYTDGRWLQFRLTSTAGLAGHHVLSAMRSSRAALVEHLVGLGRRNAAERTAHFLLELAARLRLVGLGDVKGYACPLSQYMMADALGLSAVHINRVLRELREGGMVTFQNGLVQFDDFNALVAFADFDRAYLDHDGPLLR